MIIAKQMQDAVHHEQLDFGCEGMRRGSGLIFSQESSGGDKRRWEATGDGLATDANPPITWSETTNVAWKVAVTGRGRCGVKKFAHPLFNREGAAIRIGGKILEGGGADRPCIYDISVRCRAIHEAHIVTAVPEDFSKISG